MNLSGLTNPITILPSSYPTLVTWTPALSFTLAAEECYWVVFSVESGANVSLAASQTMPTGDAGVLGVFHQRVPAWRGEYQTHSIIT